MVSEVLAADGEVVFSAAVAVHQVEVTAFPVAGAVSTVVVLRMSIEHPTILNEFQASSLRGYFL